MEQIFILFPQTTNITSFKCQENAEKLAAMWMYAAQMGSSRNLAQSGGNRSIMLIPAGSTTVSQYQDRTFFF